MPLSSAALMTGLTSSSKRTRSPITIASIPGFSPGVKAAHEVRPMNGGTLLKPSMLTGKSLRGNDTLTTLSETSGLPPVALAMAAGSIGLTLCDGASADGLAPATAGAEDVDPAGDVAGAQGDSAQPETAIARKSALHVLVRRVVQFEVMVISYQLGETVRSSKLVTEFFAQFRFLR